MTMDRQAPARASGPSRARVGALAGAVLGLLVAEAAVCAAGRALHLPVVAVAAAAVVAAVVGGTLVAALGRHCLLSLVAGAGLRVAQPYEQGEQIRVFVPHLNSVEDAELVRVGAASTTLLTARGIVRVPNAVMLRGCSTPEAR